MKTKSAVKFGLSLVFIVLLGSAQITKAQGWRVYFADTFDGTDIDSTKWNTQIATSGVRWCQPIGDSSSGEWLDVSVYPYMGETAVPPYGDILVGGGQALFGDNNGRAFPYIWRGEPSRTSPFPAEGDFIYEFRWKLNSPSNGGTGIICPLLENSDPIGDNYPFGMAGLLGFWGGTEDEWVLATPAGAISVGNNLEYKTIRFEYINEVYIIKVNGEPVADPVTSGFRPNTIFIGNPHFGWQNSAGDWADFILDYIWVLVPNTLTISSPASGYHAAMGEDVLFEGEFSADASLGTYTGEWIFSSPTNPEIRMPATLFHSRDGSFGVSDTFQFLEVGVYSIKLVITDPSGNTFDATTVDGFPAYLVVYDPDGGTFDGSLTISSQAEVDTFYYTELTGDLLIQDAGIDPILNLDGLSSLGSVAGSMTIDGNPELNNIDGLIYLATVGTGLTINDNAALTSLEGLTFLTSIGDMGLTVTSNPVLTEFCGLFTLLSTGGLGGSYTVTGNGANPTQADILASGPCGNSTFEGYVQDLKDDGTLSEGMSNPLIVFARQQNEPALHSYLSALVQAGILTPLEAQTLCRLIGPGDDYCNVGFR